MQQLRTPIAPTNWPRVSTNEPTVVRTNTNASRESAKLTGWKEIGNFVGHGVRTVQRWETELELPVHRIRNSPRSPVFAYKSELNWWMRNRAMNNTGPNLLVPPRNGTIQEARLLKNRCRSLNADLRQQLQCLIHNLDALRLLTR